MNESLPGRHGRQTAPAASSFALFALGFRPFYLLAGVFGALSVLLWAAQFSGWLPGIYLKGPLWHGHELLFGYAMAVIAGFLLTAVRVWTGRPTPTGVSLMGLAALWVLGRVLVLTPFDAAAAVANVAFPIALAVATGVPLVRAGNVRNYFFVGLLVLIGGLSLVVHLALHGMLDVPPRLGLALGLDVVLFIMAVMGGRVIPMFTNNGVPGAGAIRQPVVEKLSLGSVLLLFAATLVQPEPVAVAVIALLAALVHGIRLYLWRPWRTFAAPLVWILHAAYAWIVAHLVLRALAGMGWIAGSFATHALTVGAIGGLTLGMMVRTARGHTARPLIADGWELTCFLLVQVAAAIRVFGGIVEPAWYIASVQLSGLVWAATLGLFVLRYWPVLTGPRLDGKPG